MSEPMWFLLGVLCGGLVGAAAFLCLPKGKRPPLQAGRGKQHTRKEWAQTRNFLYYDGTEMPVVKEDINEQ